MARKTAVVTGIEGYDRDSGRGTFVLQGESPLSPVATHLFGAAAGMPVLVDEAEPRLIPAHLVVPRSDYTYFMQGPFSPLTLQGRRALWRAAKGELETYLATAPAEALAEILGEVPAVAVLDQWRTWAPRREVWYFVRDLGFSERQAKQLIEQHPDVMAVLLTAPYSLLGTRGLGFATVDRAALQIGVEALAEPRLAAALQTVTSRHWAEGHTALSAQKLLREMNELLALPAEALEGFLARAVADGVLVVYGEGPDRLFTTPGYNAMEYGVALRLRELLSEPMTALPPDLSRYPHLKAKQRQAVISALSFRLCILSGGPGTGKTTTTCTILNEFERHGLGDGIVLAAPTGKAARRMEESTGRTATTTHSLLEYHPEEGYRRNRENPLEADVVVIDEQSMMDVELFFRLLDALPNHARLLLVGDPDQLPSVDSGNVLRDLIDSGCLPVVTLDEPQRFGASSGIHRNARRLNQAQSVEYTDHDDFHWLDARDDTEIEAAILSVFAPESLEALGVTSEDVQILCPQKNGLVGVHALNERLKGLLTGAAAPQATFAQGTRTFSVGDRIMHTRNDRQLGVNNGEVGFIREVRHDRRVAVVQYDRQFRDIPFKNFVDVELAFAKTIHKSQGSEYPVVVIPVSAQHRQMLSRELVYTALTRGKKHVFMMGDRTVLETSLQHHAARGGRDTLLRQQLAALLPAHTPKHYAFRGPTSEVSPA